MKLTRISPIYLSSLLLIVGCAKTEDATPQASNTPTTQPAAADSTAQSESTVAVEPTASMMMIGQAQLWFPPARLRLSSKDGKVIARLYSDDPKDVLTGKDTVNSYDLMMTLPDISDPADVSKTAWVCRSSSMEKQDSPYGIFLNKQQDILQPMNVTVTFVRNDSRVRAAVQGTFSKFHISEQTPNPAPEPVNVMAILDASVTEK